MKKLMEETYNLQGYKCNNLKGIIAEELAVAYIRKNFSEINLMQKYYDIVARAQPQPNYPINKDEIVSKIELLKKYYPTLPTKHLDFLYENWYTIDVYAVLIDWNRVDFLKIRNKLLKWDGWVSDGKTEYYKNLLKKISKASIEKIKEFLMNPPSFFMTVDVKNLPRKLAIFEVKGTKDKLNKLEFTPKTIETHEKARELGIETYLIIMKFFNSWVCKLFISDFEI